MWVLQLVHSLDLPVYSEEVWTREVRLRFHNSMKKQGWIDSQLLAGKEETEGKRKDQLVLVRNKQWLHKKETWQEGLTVVVDGSEVVGALVG